MNCTTLAPQCVHLRIGGQSLSTMAYTNVGRRDPRIIYIEPQFTALTQRQIGFCHPTHDPCGRHSVVHDHIPRCVVFPDLYFSLSFGGNSRHFVFILSGQNKQTFRSSSKRPPPSLLGSPSGHPTDRRGLANHHRRRGQQGPHKPLRGNTLPDGPVVKVYRREMQMR